MSVNCWTQTQLPTPTGTPENMDHQDDQSSVSYAHHSTSWTPIDSITPISTNPSRKRSRDDATVEADADGSYFPTVNTPAPIPEEPVYGEGMVLLNPSTGLSISAESQTGTWYEERAEEEAQKTAQAAAQFRPKLPSCRKSVRLSQSSTKSPIDSAPPVVVAAPASPPKTAADHPEVDEATLALGIGWTKMVSEGIQAAARGWARYLENHYARHIHGAEVLLKSSGLNAYLVGCQEGFYLFTEDLLEGKLVARTWETCLQNLQAQPMVFDGQEVLRAERTPGPEAGPSQPSVNETMENWAGDNRLNGMEAVSVANGGMELD